MTKRKRARPAKPAMGAGQAKLPPPPRARPQYFRLIVEAAGGPERVIVIPRATIGLCEAKGTYIANYGMFFMLGDGTRVWAKPMMVAIESVADDAPA